MCELILIRHKVILISLAFLLPPQQLLRNTTTRQHGKVAIKLKHAPTQQQTPVTIKHQNNNSLI
jgi:hypothetical protein